MTMRSRQQDVAKSNNSPGLFLTADGEPMSFFLRPGPVKRRLQPLIISGGGMMCSVQQPGAILLIDQDDRGSIPETAAHWYVSINYIHDCIEKGKHLNVENYRLNPEDIPRHSARHVKKEGSSGLTGRAPYTPDEDAAILSYVSKHRSETGGNRLWQEMQKQHVTSHSWQSMKYRFRVQLAKKLSDSEEERTTEEETKTEVPKSSSENAASPQTHSPQPEALQTDLTQMDDQPVPAASSQPENVEAETTNVSQPEEPRVDPQEDAPIPADGTEPEAAETQATNSPQKENVPEDSPFSSFTPQKQKEKQGASPKQEQRPQRQPTRRQLEASSSPEPYGKKLRSSYSAEKLSSSPQSAKKTTTDSPPSKRARRLSVAAAASSDELESVETVVSETPQPEEESNSLEKPEKRKGKRKFGILELATKEFEDESESSEDEAADLQNPPEKAAIPTTSAEPPRQPSDSTADLVSAKSRPTAPLQEEAQQTQAVSSDSAPEKGHPEPGPAASGPAASGPAASDPAASGSAASGSAASGPAASGPAASDPSASDPSASGPAASGPAASGPAASDPSASDPSASGPSASGPAASGPAASDPAASDPAASGPAASDPAASGPAACDPAASGPAACDPSASGPAACDPAASGPAACDPSASGPAATEALHAASRAHLFIFDSESQEENSQPITGDNATALSNPQPLVRKDAAPSLTQVQVEEDMKQLSALMNQTNQDIVNVTKALLRTSGDFSAALDLLLNPSTIYEPVWIRSDDGLLISADPVVRQQLQEKYGEKELAKRVVFLELEG
ncbi:telomeric repeat-binding factor 2-interacting protein 1-like isoform X2 [Hippoglossus hippoglossus]|uniref:telomeric repeat-binding factor 2-interacting protein 1-like isoform X2 n=1 Tax=Hippoglossus hippoglossus TaxID=8267 RepID=UPI00148C6AD9|nr:telomeric repeat-binding factor 2-interacting protein 1-like isoform X2 [Hippoglossus hippoglossus]